MRSGLSRHNFTLMEVTIAAMLLAISAVATLSVVGTSRADIMREQRRRDREHYMANAVEFFLLAGPEATVPDGLLPEDMNAYCEVYKVEDGLPEQAYDNIQGWCLGEYHVVLESRNGGVVDEQFIRKILKEEDDLGIVTMGAN